MNLTKPNIKLTSEWVTGFLDAEGCFHVSFTKRPYRKTKIEVRPSLSVTQLPRSLKILEGLQSFFQCGGIRFSKKDGLYRYEIRSVPDIMKKVIPHFQQFPLVSPKYEDFLIFKIVCTRIYENKHVTGSQLEEILRLAYSMNVAGKRKHSLYDLLKLIAS